MDAVSDNPMRGWYDLCAWCVGYWDEEPCGECHGCLECYRDSSY